MANKTALIVGGGSGMGAAAEKLTSIDAAAMTATSFPEITSLMTGLGEDLSMESLSWK